MDCYKLSGQNDLARAYAGEVIRSGTGADGRETQPMRNAEAWATLAVVAARDGDLAEALAYGEQALAGERKSLPSLLMMSQDLAAEVRRRWPADDGTASFVSHLHEIAAV